MARHTGNQLNRAMRSAARSALNKLIVRGRKVASQEVRKTYNIQAKFLRDRTKLIRATNARPEAQLIIRSRPIPLIGFGAKQNKRGTTVRVKRTGGRKLIPGAFIATMPSGKIQVWMRSGSGRLPIRQLWTLSPARMFEQEGAEAFKKMVEKDMGPMLQQEFKHYLGKL